MADSRKKSRADPLGDLSGRPAATPDSASAAASRPAVPADGANGTAAPVALPAPSLAALAGLPDHLAAFLRARLKPDASLCVGLSGGRDSVALLLLCHTVCRKAGPHGLGGLRLSALHVHHGLTAEADHWADFCADLCRRLDIPLAVVRVQVPRNHPAGLEGAAREARYAAFFASGADALALAHHQDDQAETLLFRLLRGSGVNGAAAMAAERRLARPAGAPLLLLRPLLQTPRALLQGWLERQEGAAWIDDPSNADTDYARNFLRQDILPRLTGRFPRAGATLARAAGRFAEAAALLDERAEEDAAQARTPSGRLAVAALAALSPARRRNLLRYWLRCAGAAMPDEAVLAEMERQFIHGHGDAPRIKLGRHQVAAWRGELYIELFPIITTPETQNWRGEAEVPFGDGRVSFVSGQGIGIRASLLGSGGVLRVRHSRDLLRPAPGRHRRDAQRLFQEAGVPPWQRALLPALAVDERLLWLAGVGVDADCLAGPDEPGILPVWVPAAG